MANPRATREDSTHEADPLRYEYQPVSALPSPRPEPGFAFRWVAVSINGQDNPRNVSEKFREGWVPVKAVDHPEMEIPGNKSGEIEIGGLLLCKAPEEMVKGRARYYQRKTAEQAESVNSTYMKNNDSRMPLFAESKSSVSKGFGSGNSSK